MTWTNSRSNNTVEIWDVRHTPHIDRVFIGNTNNPVQSIAWLNNRLFCSGLAGSIIEIDLLTLQSKVTYNSTYFLVISYYLNMPIFFF